MPNIKINSVYRQLIGPDRTLRKDVRYFELYGGRRSGKSIATAQVLGLTAMIEADHFIVCTRKVATSLKDSVFSELQTFFRINSIPHIANKNDKEITLQNRSRFRCFGLDDPDKLKSLKDATIIWNEEATEDSEDDIDSIDAGLSPQKYPGRMIFTHNPVPQILGSMTWLQRRFLLKKHELSKALIDKESNALILRTWYKDNAFCPPETIKVLEKYKETNPSKYKLWALGEYTQLEGCVFTNWDIVHSVPDGVDTIGIGLDFGFSMDPNAAVRLWISERDLYIHQLVYKTELFNDALYSELVSSGVGEYEMVTADSARPDIIADLYRLGLYGIKGVKKRANYKEDVATRLQGYRIHLIEGDTDLIREFSTYAWARDKNNKQLPKLQDGDDHLVDATIMRIHEYSGKVSIYDVI
jgi:phage terminase large subunit